MRQLYFQTAMGLILTVISTASNAASLTIFSDKTAFVAATAGATSATNALPDLGFIADGTETVGTITFNQAGTHGIFIGTSGTGSPEMTGLRYSPVTTSRLTTPKT